MRLCIEKSTLSSLRCLLGVRIRETLGDVDPLNKVPFKRATGKVLILPRIYAKRHVRKSVCYDAEERIQGEIQIICRWWHGIALCEGSEDRSPPFPQVDLRKF